MSLLEMFWNHHPPQSNVSAQILEILISWLVYVQVGNQRVELTLSELQEMATRQQQQIEAQQSHLVAKEQRLKYLKQQEYQQHQMATEYDRLRRWKSSYNVSPLCVHVSREDWVTRSPPTCVLDILKITKNIMSEFYAIIKIRWNSLAPTIWRPRLLVS